MHRHDSRYFNFQLSTKDMGKRLRPEVTDVLVSSSAAILVFFGVYAAGRAKDSVFKTRPMPVTLPNYNLRLKNKKYRGMANHAGAKQQDLCRCSLRIHLFIQIVNDRLIC